MISKSAVRQRGPSDGSGVVATGSSAANALAHRRVTAAHRADAPIDKLLPRLQRVRRTGPGRWMASSPTREDRSPSLAIRELEDGTLLLHDFGGDDVAQIVEAVGLTLADLYTATGAPREPVHRPFAAADVLDLVAFEASVAMVICTDFLRLRELPQAAHDRLVEAARRLGDAAEVCRGRR